MQVASPVGGREVLPESVSPQQKEKGDRRSSAGSGARESYPGFYGRLRDLRAVAQNVRAFAVELAQRVAAIEDAETRGREVVASLADGTSILQHDRAQGQLRLAEVREIVQRDDAIYSAYGDVVARLEASWEEALASWPPDGETERAAYIAQIARRLLKLVAALDAIVYDCGLVTLPSRISTHLTLMPIGGSLSFREAYADELPRPEDQHRFLQYLDLYPGFVEGLVDVENGCIYRADPRSRRRALSLVWTAGIALSGFLLIALARLLGDSMTLTEWPFTAARFQELMTGYFFLLLGAAGHIVVNLLKQDRAGAGSTRGLWGWLLRIHVKEGSFMLSAVSLALAPIAMAFFFKSVDWKTAFFFGYSYDSFLDLFLQRFEGMVSSASESMKKG